MQGTFKEGKPVDEGKYQPTDTEDEIYFTWSDLVNWEQIQRTVAIGDMAILAQEAIESLKGLIIPNAAIACFADVFFWSFR